MKIRGVASCVSPVVCAVIVTMHILMRGTRKDATQHQPPVVSTEASDIACGTGPVHRASAPSPAFIAGFEAGVKYGILSYMNQPSEDDVRVHIKHAKCWYYLIVVDKGKTLIKEAARQEETAQ